MPVSALLIRSRSVGVDVFSDLQCTRVTSNTDTYSDATATSNTAKINAWLLAVAITPAPAMLVIPWGYVAINDTLGALITGGPDDGTRTLPNNTSIICGGGWANGFYSVLNPLNTQSAGFVRVGTGNTNPMVRISGFGNVISGNFFGQPFIAAAQETPTGDRADCAIELYRLNSGPTTGKATIAITAQGCTAACYVSDGGGNSNCDLLDFPFLMTRNCLRVFESDCDQSVGHTFGKVAAFVPNESNVLFKFNHGGRSHFGSVDAIGDWGTTILEGPLSGGPSAGCFVFDSVFVDRAILLATKGVTDKGLFKLVKSQSGTSLFVTMTGMLARGDESLSTPWFNRDASSAVSLHSPGVGEEHSIKLRMANLDTATAAAYA